MYSFSKMRFISQSLGVFKLDGEEQQHRYFLQHFFRRAGNLQLCRNGKAHGGIANLK